MPVVINELTVHTEVRDNVGPLDSDMVAKLVQIVLKELAKQQADQKSHSADIDTRSIVDQQRGGRR